MVTVTQQLASRPHLFSKSCRSNTFKTTRKAIHVTVAVVVLTVICIGLYLGATWDPFFYFSNLTVAIINLDGDGSYGRYVHQSLVMDPTFSYVVDPQIDADSFIRSYTGWFAITIPQNFTQKLNDSLYLGAPYNDNSIILTYDDSRNFIGSRYAGSIINITLSNINANFKRMMLATRAINIPNVDPRVIISPISVKANIINPLLLYGSYTASTALFFFVIMMAQASVSNLLRIYNAMLGTVNPHELFLVRFAHAQINYILAALFTTIIVYGMGIPTNVNFFVFFLYFCLALSCFAAIIAFLNSILGPYTNLVFPVFVIINYAGSGAVAPFELAPRLFKYGIILPMYHAINGAKYIVLSTGHEIGLNIGVLFIYWISFLVLTLSFYYWNIYRAMAKVETEVSTNKIAGKEHKPYKNVFIPYGGHATGPMFPEKQSSLYEENQAVQGLREHHRRRSMEVMQPHTNH
jgi:hypothetical protein